MAEGMREISGASFVRVLIPFMRVLSSRPDDLLKALPLNTIMPGISLKHMNFGGEGIVYIVHIYS